MPYSELRSDAISSTLATLTLRVEERFPKSSLLGVCREVVQVAAKTDERCAEYQRPYILLRLYWLVGGAILTGLVTFLGVWLTSEFTGLADGHLPFEERPGLALFEGLEPAINVFLLIGAGFFFMTRQEEKIKRERILKHIHQLRSLTHVVDMHQLTKDPTAILGEIKRTAHSPIREMSRYELSRYLDYCAELLALIGKIAALYMRDVEDIEVITAANEIENLTTNISRKIWQKIMIMGQMDC
ncbi:MAG: hypothetical protein AAFR20_01120 [Pseudomonadota bacterium]